MSVDNGMSCQSILHGTFDKQVGPDGWMDGHWVKLYALHGIKMDW